MKIAVVCISSINILQSLAAIEKTANALPYQSNKILISDKPPSALSKINYIQVLPMLNKTDYCREIMCGEISKLDYDFFIIVQWDGFAINPNNWTDEFLKYDYIGAPIPPWYTITQFPSFTLRTSVGNGGFSLRSRKWIKATRELPVKFPEDYWCAVINKKHYQKKECKIAPIDLAMKFSFEHRILEHPFWSLNKSFGFHGEWHLPSESFPYETSSLAPENTISRLVWYY